MTREEARKRLIYDWYVFPVSLGGKLCVDSDKKDVFLEAIQLAIEALSQPERPKGRWVKYGYKWKCSECDSKINIDGTPEENGLYYCPNCGSDNRGEEE